MTVELLLKAFFLGVINAAPIGPVGLLCLKKNAAGDRLRGIFTALGMAIAYSIVAFCVLFGMKWIQGFLESWRCPIELVAGAALFFMGWKSLRSEAVDKFSRKKSRLVGDFLSSFAMTVFNPVPFATFAVLLTTLKIHQELLALSHRIAFALTVSTGTLAFWLVLQQLLHLVKKRSTSDWCRWISHGAAVSLIVIGTSIFGAGIWLGITLLTV